MNTAERHDVKISADTKTGRRGDEDIWTETETVDMEDQPPSYDSLISPPSHSHSHSASRSRAPVTSSSSSSSSSSASTEAPRQARQIPQTAPLPPAASPEFDDSSAMAGCMYHGATYDVYCKRCRKNARRAQRHAHRWGYPAPAMLGPVGRDEWATNPVLGRGCGANMYDRQLLHQQQFAPSYGYGRAVVAGPCGHRGPRGPIGLVFSTIRAVAGAVEDRRA